MTDVGCQVYDDRRWKYEVRCTKVNEPWALGNKRGSRKSEVGGGKSEGHVLIIDFLFSVRVMELIKQAIFWKRKTSYQL